MSTSTASQSSSPDFRDRSCTACLSPITDYYIRKLIRQHFDQLVSMQPDMSYGPDLYSSSAALGTHLGALLVDLPAIAPALDALVLRHQTLRTQGANYQAELQQVEEQIFEYLGLRRVKAIAQAKILIIDDTLETLKLLTATLHDRGYAVEQFSNGGDALNHIYQCQPDLILLDVMMPQIDGYEVCERLKLDPRTCHIPVLFLSAIGTASDKVKAFAMGGVDYVTKPFQLEEVLARVDYQLSLYRRQQNSRHKLEVQKTYQSFFENAIEGMFQTSLDGKFLSANQALATLLGYDSPDDLMHSVQDIARQLYTIPQRRAQFVLYLEQYGQTDEFEVEVFCKNGDRIWIREMARAVRDAEGNLQFYEGTIQHVTQQQRSDAI